MVEHLIHDLRYAIRTLAKRPILLATTTISIGLGVGVNVAVYSVLRQVLFPTGLSAAAPDEHFLLKPGLSYPNYFDLRESPAFAELALMQASTLTWRAGDSTTTIGARVVSQNFFEVLGTRSVYGRVFGSKDDARTVSGADEVVISYAFWKRLGGDQSVMERPLYLNGWPYTVAGVLPAGVYSMVFPLIAPSVYVPAGPRVNRGLEARSAAQFDVVGRVPNGMTREQLSSALRIAAVNLERRFPDANAGLSRDLSIAPVSGILQRLQQRGSRAILGLAAVAYGVVVLILLVTCANVAGLLLARAAERATEISIRLALGASRWRILQQFLAESLVVAIPGCLAGATLWATVTAVLPRTSLIASSGIELIPAPVSLIQCGLLVVVVMFATGLAPALSANQFAPGRRRSRSALGLKRWSVGKSLVAGQVGVAFILLTGACALLFINMRQRLADPGFDVAHTVSIQMRMPTTSNGVDLLTVRDALTRVPSVEAVTFGDLPQGLIAFNRVYKAGSTVDGGLAVQINRVGPRYLETLVIPVLRGRDLSDDDVRRSPGTATPVVVDETFARRYFGSADVLDRELVLPRDSENGTAAGRLRVVGVSQAGAVQAFGGDQVPVIYLPALSTSLVVRVAGSGAGALRTLERTVSAVAPGAAITVAPMTQRLSAVLLPVRVAMVFLSALGIVGLLLAMSGLYGIVSYAASRRRFEIGVRMALGASRFVIVRLIARDAVVMVGAGSIIGGVLSLGLIRALWPLLPGGAATVAPVALGAVLVVMVTVGLAAALRPALRSASIDPSVALRQE